MKIGVTIQSYMIIAVANGYVMGKSPTAPQPYAVWKVDDDGKGVSIGRYFVDREEAEWDFCARAFEWFEDNMYIHMIEDGEETGKMHSVFDTPTIKEQSLDDKLIGCLWEIRGFITVAAQLVDEMCAELDRLKAERRGANESND